jgi:hypothetical protein
MKLTTRLHLVPIKEFVELKLTSPLLIFLLHIQGASGLILVPEAGYRCMGGSWFYSVPPMKYSNNSLHFLTNLSPPAFNTIYK